MTDGSRQQRVLIVDDTPENIAVLVEALRDQYELSVAVDGATALEIATSENRPDLILPDIMVPGMDGFEVCECLKSSPSTADIPVIFVTALNEMEDEAKGLDAGAIDYIRKPFSLPIVAARVKNHLELKQHRDFLKNLSSMDGLTGIANRRRFDETLEREWHRAARSSVPISLVMIDVNSFKAYNDHYGHVAGDECLRVVAQVLQACFARSTDLVARYGGEEFAAILPGTDEPGAAFAARKAVDEIRSREIEHVCSAAADRLTVSAGVASTIPAPGTSPEFLVQVADKMLYQAKTEGRNRVKSSSIRAE